MIEGEEWMKMRQLLKQGMKISEVAKYLGVSRGTIYNNKDKTNIPKYKRETRGSILDAYKEYISSRLEKINLTASKLYDEIKTTGYQGKYSLVAEYVSSIKKEQKNLAVLRFETIAGEQSQVDWGYFGQLYDKKQKKWIELHCFFMILGYSRMLYIEFFERAHLSNFLKGHNNAFKYFGGYTREILYDNLKSVVIKRAISAEDSDFNKKFMDYAGYYGFKPILCRAYKPNTKGK
jgi:transposase